VRASTGTPPFTTAIAPSSALWVTVSPDSGKTPGTLTIRVNPTSLGVGMYSAVVNVTVSGVVTPLAIPVTLNVSAPLPTLTLSTTTLNFVAPPTPVPAQTVTLSTSGLPVSFTAAVAGTSWLTVTPSTGIVLPGEDLTLSIVVDPTALTPQSKPYTGRVTITASGVPAANKTQNISCSLIVNSSTPTITSMWPSTVQTNTGPATITLRGANYYGATTVKANGTALAASTVTLLSPTAIQAIIPATLLTAPGTVSIVASNPAPGGDSLPATLTVSSAPVVQAILNAASWAGGAVSPGEIVTMFGVGIGPAAPVYMTDANGNGYVDTNIGGLNVTIDAQPAPILYADPNQITVQVPYEVTQGTNKAVVVTNGTGTPANGTVLIGATAPGIFTADGSGAGQIAALVYSSTAGTTALNSSTNPAHAGDIVEFYLTGEGDYLTAPAAHTGYIIPSSSVPANMPTLPAVTIGGAAATVNYAGPIPGSMVGLLQINAIVPNGATTGAAVPVTVSIGGTPSQANTTIVVK